MILNVISSVKSGGAELLVGELHGIYKKKGVNSKVIYFSGSSTGLDEDQDVFGLNPRNPLNIIYFRRKIVTLLNVYDGEVVIHVHLTWPLYYVAIATLGISNVKLYYTEHNTNNTRRKYPVLRFIDRLIYNRYSKIVCISEAVRFSLSKWLGFNFNDRLITIPNGSRIFPVFNRTSLNGRKPILISIGSLTFKKNFKTLLYALCNIKDVFDKYILIGEGPKRQDLERIISENGLVNKVQLIGWTDNIQPYLNSADIQIIPSMWEGFGLVAVEGMSTGLPIVCSNVEGLRDVVNADGISVTLVDDIESFSAWSNAILLAIRNLNLHGQNKLAHYSRTQAELFTLERMADNYLKVYHEF